LPDLLKNRILPPIPVDGDHSDEALAQFLLAQFLLAQFLLAQFLKDTPFLNDLLIATKDREPPHGLAALTDRVLAHLRTR
jgi:hypothetical protein